MRYDQDLDIVVDLVNVHLELADIEVALQFTNHHPRFLRLLAMRAIIGSWIAEHRQRRHDADSRRSGVITRVIARECRIRAAVRGQRQKGQGRL